MKRVKDVSPKRIKIEEIFKEDKDRISVLPDCLTVEILSRLPTTKEAVRTCLLSKRWTHVWTPVPNLIFEYNDVNLPGQNFISFVDNALTQRGQLKVNKFELYSNYYFRFKSKFNDWIRYAINCNVEELILTLRSLWNMDFGVEFELDQRFFTTSCFTNLKLAGCLFNPTSAISWKNLKSLRISYAKLNESLIANIVSGSPLLETLKFQCCYGYRRLDITSKGIKNLVFSRYSVPCVPVEDPDFPDDLEDIIEINAPYILTLKIRGSLYLRMLSLLNVSSVVNAKLEYMTYGRYGTTPEEAQEEMLKGFILKLRHVRELTIGDGIFKVLSRLKNKGFSCPLNMKNVHVTAPLKWRSRRAIA